MIKKYTAYYSDITNKYYDSWMDALYAELEASDIKLPKTSDIEIPGAPEGSYKETSAPTVKSCNNDAQGDSKKTKKCCGKCDHHEVPKKKRILVTVRRRIF